MASVTLKSPVRHNDTLYVADDVITDLTQKEAERLVRLGVAVAGEVVTIPDDDPPAPTKEAGITPEQTAEIKKMTKAKLIAALAAAGVEADDSEKAADLKAKLTAAWAAAPAGDDDEGELSADELAQIAEMERAELIESLEVAGVEFLEDEPDDELRAKLKTAWADGAVGD